MLEGLLASILEGLLVGFFNGILAMWLIATLWVYRDARKRGKRVLIALLWFFANLVLLIVFLPLWLICRPKQYIDIPEAKPWKPSKDFHIEIHKDNDSKVLCKGCGKPLPQAQIDLGLGSPKCNEWHREGFCCLDCFEKHRDHKP